MQKQTEPSILEATELVDYTTKEINFRDRKHLTIQPVSSICAQFRCAHIVCSPLIYTYFAFISRNEMNKKRQKE